MEKTKLQLNLPSPGVAGGWGNNINNNFRILERSINNIYNEVNRAQSIIGAGAPLYKELDTHYFVYIKKRPVSAGQAWTSTDGFVLTYYSKNLFGTSHDAQDVNEFIQQLVSSVNLSLPTYYTSPKSDDELNVQSIPLYVGAYILNADNNSDLGEFSTLYHGSNYTFVQGDLMVRVSEFGSLYSENYESVSFRPYPHANKYAQPVLGLDTPYRFTYKFHNIVSWLFEQTKTYTLPAMGYGIYYKEEWNRTSDNDIWHLSATFARPSDLDQEDVLMNIKFIENTGAGSHYVYLPFELTGCNLSDDKNEIVYNFDINVSYIDKNDSNYKLNAIITVSYPNGVE